ncbi:MAG TPA: metalloregulator ArsR/SmtB family transcription factor [Pyrinomonadaceae bacterium]|jgi:ArsR family transcriptional regulator
MDDKRFQKVAKALADPRRFGILQTIAESNAGKICSGNICETVSVAQATVSHHLKELTEADLIIPNCEGQFKFFTVNFETLNEYVVELKLRLKLD